MQLSKVLDTIDNTSVWIGKTVSWLCLMMIGVLLYEIIARYLFNSPTEWAHESTTILYGTFCIIGGVWTLREKGHVRSEVIYQILPPRVQISFDILTGLITLAIFTVFFYAAVDFAAESWKIREISSKSTWGVAIYPFKTVIPLAVALMFIQSLSHLLRNITRLIKGTNRIKIQTD